MTKAEAFDKAWKMAIKDDFSLFDQIVHQNYESIERGKAGQYSINKNMRKAVLSGRSENLTLGPFQTIHEDANFICMHRYSRSTISWSTSRDSQLSTESDFYSMMTAVKYEKGKVINQQTVREKLDYDPSEGQDWNWKDYE